MAKVKLPARDRIVRAAADLLAKGGRGAVSTRAVAAAANVQAPAIYRHFGDMQGLLDAAAREVLAGYVRGKARRSASKDPVADLRRGWDEHVAFGLANPAAYTLIYGRDDADVPAAKEGFAMLEALVTRVAEAGRLRVSVRMAARLIHAGARGVTLSLMASPDDVALSRAMRDAVLAAVTVGRAAAPRAIEARAVALRAVLPEAGDRLSDGERVLLDEWLARLSG